MHAITVERMAKDGLIQYDAREWAAGITNLVRTIRARRDERLAQMKAAAKAQADRKARGGRGGR